jgi:MoaA/NifB/PqqE/SkfB family radical SAM enzyme
MTATAALEFLALELTTQCQLECDMCYIDAGPSGTHGTMNSTDWVRILDEAADMGVRTVQFIGGEPTLHPALPELIRHALSRALAVEVFTNLVHVSDELWQLFAQPAVSLATSYFSDDPDQHNAITRRPSHARTKANITKALKLGIQLRAGVIDLGDGQRAEQGQAELVDLGVPKVGYDRQRHLGRASRDRHPSADQLCGRCGDGAAAIGPDGTLRPCSMSRWMSLGSVHDVPLAQVAAGLTDARAQLTAQGMPATRRPCAPEGDQCYPADCQPR